LHKNELTDFCPPRTLQIFCFWTIFNPRLSLPRENAAAHPGFRVAAPRGIAAAIGIGV
jgi:hypothetical protein